MTEGPRPQHEEYVMDEETKEWVKVSHSPGRTMVSVTLQQGNLSVKWQVKTFGVRDEIKNGVIEARKRATAALAELTEATA